MRAFHPIACASLPCDLPSPLTSLPFPSLRSASAIFYALIARKTIVLAEFTGRTGNFPTVTRNLLTKIPEGDSKQSYIYDECVPLLPALQQHSRPPLPLRPPTPSSHATPLSLTCCCCASRHLLPICTLLCAPSAPPPPPTPPPPCCAARNVFHYIIERGVTYLCLTDEKNKRRLPFAFLDDIKGKFQAAYAHERIAVAIAFSMNAEFSRVMEDRLNYFNDNPQADAFGKVKGQLEDVKGVMVDNIEKVSARSRG